MPAGGIDGGRINTVGLMRRFSVLPLLSLILYVPFHLAEEAVGDFPRWMSARYPLPQPISVSHWLINNGVFLVVLLAGLGLFHYQKCLACGLGLLIWSFINGLEHVVFTFLDGIPVPGLFTALGFIVLTGWGFTLLYQEGLLTGNLILKALGAGFLYWLIPILVFISTGPALNRAFP